ncbi:hypothetical protein [Sanguibacter antarcticus]|uniref:Uncharacterized protein n=1 Tax=Sanguibacter antarcticus TaxID=372484 RepID=A0A2A9E846_9MICO|nr:hypothetical protein [Sanguibacter antarcticus]PFG34485.1 hypothetical protein ATL42_2395 [Sanguibacter antarcticus]
MTEHTTSDATTVNPSELPYDPATDPDAQPESLSSKAPTQPNQAEGADVDEAPEELEGA